MSYLGELLAVASGLTWAGASIFFRLSGQTVPPLGLNLFKNGLAIVLLTLTMILAGEAFFPAGLAAADYALVLASGAVGIAVSDTLYFASINALGASLSAVVATLYSPFIISLSLIFLGERLSLKQTAGVLLIISAVLIISYRRVDLSLSKRALSAGIAAGVLAQLATAVGIVILKPRLSHYPLLWVTNIRVGSGLLFLAVPVLVHPGRKLWLGPLRRRANWKFLVPATVLGSYLSMIAWMGGMKYALASVAAALNQLSTVFIFIMAIVFLKEKATPLKVAAVAMAAAGAILASAP
jgi:drug/metabolite transporter (DMT)-like permease